MEKYYDDRGNWVDPEADALLAADAKSGKRTKPARKKIVKPVDTKKNNGSDESDMDVDEMDRTAQAAAMKSIGANRNKQPKLFNAFVTNIDQWQKSKFLKNGHYEYNISTVDFANANNPSEKYTHHVHQTVRAGGPLAELMRGFDEAMKFASTKLRTPKDRIVVKNVTDMQYYGQETTSGRNWIAPTDSTEIYVVGGWGNVKMRINDYA